VKARWETWFLFNIFPCEFQEYSSWFIVLLIILTHVYFIFEVLQYVPYYVYNSLLQWEKPEEMIVFEREQQKQQQHQEKPTIQQSQTQLQPLQQQPQQVQQQYQGQQLQQPFYSSLVGFVFMLVTFKYFCHMVSNLHIYSCSFGVAVSNSRGQP